MKPKRCKVCKSKYTPKRMGQRVCGPGCALFLAKSERAKKERAQLLADRRKVREKLKTRSDWMREAQTAVNKYVRLRDHGLPCISCGSMPEQKFGGTMDCGHYRSVGSSPGTRFDLRNMAAQCVRCNRHLGGNAVEFRKGLIERIGLEEVEALEADNTVHKWTVDELKEIKARYARMAKELRDGKAA